MNAPDDGIDLLTVRDRDRLQELADLGLADPEVDAVLKELAAEAAEKLDMPISLVSIVLDEAQYFAASHGLTGWLADTRGTPVEWSFCAHAVSSREPFVVEDAVSHPATSANPLVTEDGIRCYAGIPLISSRGFALGTLCVLGLESRTFEEKDLEVLRSLADKAIRRIETRRSEAGGSNVSR